eukprot:2101780-Rhodomonas_salina.1
MPENRGSNWDEMVRIGTQHFCTGSAIRQRNLVLNSSNVSGISCSPHPISARRDIPDRPMGLRSRESRRSASSLTPEQLCDCCLPGIFRVPDRTSSASQVNSGSGILVHCCVARRSPPLNSSPLVSVSYSSTVNGLTSLPTSVKLRNMPWV